MTVAALGVSVVFKQNFKKQPLVYTYTDSPHTQSETVISSHHLP